MFGIVLLKFTVSLLILDLTSSAALFGTITAISYLPPVFLSPIGGIIADRNNKQPCSGLNTAQTVEFILAHPRWRLSLQTHKLINIQ